MATAVARDLLFSVLHGSFQPYLLKLIIVFILEKNLFGCTYLQLIDSN